jgi:hypothetical protein
MTPVGNWQKSSTDIFWAEIAPSDHVLQIYENESAFSDTLTGFVGGGINAGECVIIIATRQHLQELDKRLTSFGISTSTLIQDNRYIPLDAEETLQKFMVDGWPDEDLFFKTVSGLLLKANAKKRRVRAFGEMVAILWAKGMNGATVQLEHLWNKFCATQSFALFCAYPKNGVTEDLAESLENICACHSKLIHGSDNSLTEVMYREITHRQAV